MREVARNCAKLREIALSCVKLSFVLNEAQRAFRNCVESAKAGIVSAHANEADKELVCYSLENMLAGCNSQVKINNFVTS